jgi:hypothetical protein
VCPVDPQHGHDPCCGRTRCTHRTIAPQKSGTPQADGVSWWMHGVSADPLRRLRKRAALSPSRSADSAAGVEGRARHRAAGGVSGGCDVWDVRTPLPAFLERSPSLQAPPKPPAVSCAAAAVVGQPPHPLAHEKSAAESVVKPRGERCWRGRYRSCPTSLSLCSIRIPIRGLLARALLPPYAVDTR